jgi:hypothetical protein
MGAVERIPAGVSANREAQRLLSRLGPPPKFIIDDLADYSRLMR